MYNLYSRLLEVLLNWDWHFKPMDTADTSCTLRCIFHCTHVFTRHHCADECKSTSDDKACSISSEPLPHYDLCPACDFIWLDLTWPWPSGHGRSLGHVCTLAQTPALLFCHSNVICGAGWPSVDRAFILISDSLLIPSQNNLHFAEFCDWNRSKVIGLCSHTDEASLKGEELQQWRKIVHVVV